MPSEFTDAKDDAPSDIANKLEFEIVSTIPNMDERV